MEMFKEYLKERENKEVIENEYGFLVYKIFDKECFLADFYIKPAFRKTFVVGDFVSQLEVIAKDNGCECITAQIQIADKGHKVTLSAAFKLGFNIVSSNNNAIIIMKEVVNG